MCRMALRQASLCSLLLSFALAPSASAQGRGRVKQKQPTEVSPVGGADSLNNLKFRNLGPSVAGGRVAAVVGVPGDRNLYYAGPAAGGVWKTIDGGDSWEAVFKEQPTASIGAIALAPSNPNVVWVGTGEGNPRNDVVDGGGVFMSPDAGKSWRFMGLGDVGQVTRIVIDPADPDVVFVAALGHVWAPNPERGVFRSADGGKTWQKVLLVNKSTGAADLVMVPGNRRLLFAGMWQFVRRPWELVSRGVESGVYRSDDGGKTTTPIDRGVHVDHHALWIDPQNPDRMIQGNDGGVYLSENGAKSWRFLNNLPIGQFYMVAADNNTPYMLCGGLQDNNAWCGPSSNVGTGGGGGGGGGGAGGGVNGSEWFTVAGGDGEYAVPAPTDSSILYVDSQNGNITRVDLKTGLNRSIRPSLSGVKDTKPANLQYRFNWTSPIAVSPRDANTVYMGGNVVFKSTDGGDRWAAISPDLTRNDKTKRVTSGGPINYDISGAETYNTILTVNLAPTDSNVIWVGTDDGLVRVTRDGGKTWTNVSGHFPGLTKDVEGRVRSEEHTSELQSHHDLVCRLLLEKKKKKE